MRLLKILIILIFVVSLTITNICQTAGVPNNRSDSGTGQILISGLENLVSPIFFYRSSQKGKFNTTFTGLSKLILSSSSKTKLLHNCNFTPFNSFCETKESSLASLHCLLTI